MALSFHFHIHVKVKRDMHDVQNTCDAGDSLSSVMLMAVGMWLKQLLSASPVSEVLGVLARPVMV